MDNNEHSFVIRDCALVAIATGEKALTLKELRDRLQTIPSISIYHHFWGGLLQPRFEEREYNNDFAAWIRHAVHDTALAERLAVLNPVMYEDLDALRQRMVELIDNRLDEVEHLGWTRATQQYEFLCSQIVVFDTHRRLTTVAELADLVPRLSTGSIFYHFIDARRRTTERMDDFSLWLATIDDGHPELREQLAAVDPFFGSLTELRAELAGAFRTYLQGTGP